MKTYNEKLNDELLIGKEVSRKIKILGKRHNLNFTKETLFRDARKKLEKIYPQLIFPDEYLMSDYNKELDKLI